jgi:hypothetical protein
LFNHIAADLEDKTNITLDFQRKLETYNTSMGRYSGSDSEAEKKVLREIIAAGRDGIWQKDVAERAALNRSYVFEIANWLHKHGEITIIAVGNRRKYFAKVGKVTDLVLGPFLQGRYIFRELVKKKRPIFNGNVVKVQAEELPNLELSLTMFSLSLGAAITYLLVQAVGKGNSVIADAYYDSARGSNTGSNVLHSFEKEQILRDWIKNALSSIIPLLPSEFTNIIHNAVAQRPLSYDDRIALLDKAARLQMNETIANQVRGAFAKILEPGTARKLQKIETELPKIIENERLYISKAERGESRSPIADSSDKESTELKLGEKTNKKRNHRHNFIPYDVGEEHYYEKCTVCGIERASPRRPRS